MKGTIKSTEEISSLFKTARKFSTDTLIALIRKIDRERGFSGRVAFVAGKRLGTAPRRNRAKRLLREAARRAGGPWSDYDIVIIAREKTAESPLLTIMEDMERLCNRIEKTDKARR